MNSIRCLGTGRSPPKSSKVTRYESRSSLRIIVSASLRMSM